MGDQSAHPVVAVRGYRPTDLQDCRDLWVELTNWHRRIYENPDIGGEDPGRQFDAHLERVGPDCIWVAEWGGRIVGLAGLIRDQDDAELEPLVVRDAHRGRGIGRQLVQTVIDAARRDGSRRLGVRPVARNGSAIRFFHGAGFRVLGHVEMLMEPGPSDHGNWRDGERLASRDFQV
jgi:GNAT superfamily N-acetyltransferase